MFAKYISMELILKVCFVYMLQIILYAVFSWQNKRNEHDFSLFPQIKWLKLIFYGIFNLFSIVIINNSKNSF